MRRLLLWMSAAMCVVAGISCDETLPPYHDPADVFQSKNNALYAISITDNSLKVFVNIVNVFDDAFDGTTLMQGSVTIEWSGNAAFKKTFAVSPSSIISARDYNPVSRKLTITPGDAVRLGFSWNFVADDGRLITNWVTYHKDPSCQQRWISNPLTFAVRSQVKVYDKTALVTAPTLLYTFVHHRQYFSDQYCTPLPSN